MNLIINIGTLSFVILGFVFIDMSRRNFFIPVRRVLLFWAGLFFIGITITRIAFQLNIIDFNQNRLGNSLIAIGALLIVATELLTNRKQLRRKK